MVPKEGVFGGELIFLDEIDSTNTHLKRLAQEGAPEGTVVIAETQTAGRGRLGRGWMSAPNLGVWMSILLKPALQPNQTQTITLAASVAVARALEQIGTKGIGIKWPNDILVDGKKVCGILTELSAEVERVKWIVVGIGLNVNHLDEDFPAEIKSIATSLRLSSEDKTIINRNHLAYSIIKEFDNVYNIFIKPDGDNWVIEQWKKRNITLGKRVKLMNSQGVTQVDVIDITSDGQLIVRYDDATTGKVVSGEITLREA